jgi:hypothetical protein
MTNDGMRAESLMMLSSAARRISDLVAASEAPLRYEVIRHLLRVSEETMTEVLEEAVRAGLVKRGEDPFTYIPATEALGEELREALGEDRLATFRRQIAGAKSRVLGD